MERSLEGAWERAVRAKARVLQRVERHPPDVRKRRPDGSAWSMVDVVEHLWLSEAGMVAALARAPSPDRPRIVAPGGWYRWWGLRAALVAGIRIKAPVDSILPRRELAWPDLTARWDGERARLARWLDEIDPGILGAARFKHPLIGWLTVGQALTFAADHLDHHWQQLRRIEGRLGV